MIFIGEFLIWDSLESGIVLLWTERRFSILYPPFVTRNKLFNFLSTVWAGWHWRPQNLDATERFPDLYKLIRFLWIFSSHLARIFSYGFLSAVSSPSIKFFIQVGQRNHLASRFHSPLSYFSLQVLVFVVFAWGGENSLLIIPHHSHFLFWSPESGLVFPCTEHHFCMHIKPTDNKK